MSAMTSNERPMPTEDRTPSDRGSLSIMLTVLVLVTLQ